MKVLVACEFSGIVRDAFAAKGHDAWSCDILTTERPGQHLEGDVEQIVAQDPDWDLMIAHPPCTYLTNAGVRHLHSIPSCRGTVTKIHGESRCREMIRAAAFFISLLQMPIPRICVENPIPHGYARRFIGNYSQLIQPWQFGHGEKKATCLWLKGLSPLQHTKLVSGREQLVFKTPPSADRWKIRSRTYEGIAKAMAEQWG